MRVLAFWTLAGTEVMPALARAPPGSATSTSSPAAQLPANLLARAPVVIGILLEVSFG